MNLFKKHKAHKEGQIILDHGNNDIRIDRIPGNLIHLKQGKKEQENKSCEHKKTAADNYRWKDCNRC